jgi:hypothetical protein
MGKVNISKNLPESKIISELCEKANCKKGTRIDFLAKLDELRHRISSEVKYIVKLFPEYTPHDEEHHLSRLFFLGDELLGDAVIANLNSTELFILASSLYGHDWGMAVSDNEMELISYDKNDIENDFGVALIDGERLKFQAFMKENNLKSFNDISLFHWQEYIRNTHAIRSGERIRKYFESIDSGLGEAIARASEGHWLDFKDIQNPHSYPTNFAVSNETVNLRAIALYVRLIDLLDITQERTPYVIWKYVAPKSIRSKMEWQKHKAIHSLVFPPYQGGRVVQVDGGTNSHEVYAALQDLRNFCDEQLKGCNDILTQINDSRYDLNIFHIDWRIQPRTFKPISIQFEFDRVRMFEILSDEIYQGDKYVFLRELLQNSIDAIGVRRAILEQKGLKPISIGQIIITVQNKTDGDCEITFSDDGIGMDEYVIKNYLSIAGKSYYNSDDFKRLGLSLDPISKFGVGVLSCFMVADEIEIETFMDPYMSNGSSEKIEIRIPAVGKQFRINSFITKDAKVGTIFKIHVIGTKIRSGNQKVDKLKVTEYMLRIAGFVKVPIKIIEDGIETLIIHPNENSSEYQVLFPKSTIKKLDLSYPWEKAFLPQSLKNSKEILQEKKINVVSDLNLGDIVEGVISYVEPINYELLIYNQEFTWPGTDFLFKDKHGTVNKRIQFNRDWTEYDRPFDQKKRDDTFGKSAQMNEQFKIYLDGILLPNANPPEQLFSRRHYGSEIEDEEDRVPGLEDRFVLPQIILNFKKSALKGIDLSRTELIKQDNKEHWEHSLKKSLQLYFENNSISTLKELAADARLLSVVNLILFNRKRVTELTDSIPLGSWPVPVITQGGVFVVKQWGDLMGKEIFLEPHRFVHFSKFLVEKFEGVSADSSPLDKWEGGEFILTNMKEGGLRNNSSSQTILMIKLYNLLIKKTHVFSRFRFLGSPWKEGPPLIQSIWEPTEAQVTNEGNPDDSQIDLTELEFSIKDFDSLDFKRFKYLWNKIIQSNDINGIDFYMVQSIGIFEKPFESKVCYGFRILNYNNSLVKNILRLIFTIFIEKKKGVTSVAILNDIEDKINDLAFFDFSSEYEGYDLDELNSLIDAIFSDAAKNLNFLERDGHRFSVESFVENSLVPIPEKGMISYFHKEFDNVEIDLDRYSKPLK